MEFHILCGIPGCGKSTLSNRLHGYIVSTDHIRKFLWSDASIHKHGKLTFTIAETIIEYMLSSGENVIFDATNITRFDRKKYIDIGKKYNANVLLHWINCPLDISLKRNSRRERKVPQAIIERFYMRFQEPSIDEDMDILNIYNSEIKLVRSIYKKP